MIRKLFADRKSQFVLILVACMTFTVSSRSIAQEAEWIWSPEHKKTGVPQVACHFRKSFRIGNPESGQITIAADDEYELYLNGRKIGNGGTSKNLDKFDISRFLSRGNNLIAVKVSNRDGNTAALVARVMVKPRGHGWTSFSTNASWKTNLRPLPLWNLPIYNDSRWAAAQSFGKLGATVPWDRAKHVAADRPQKHERFKINREFQIQRAVSDEQSGSLIAMTFNEFGQIIASVEGGSLVLISDTNKDDIPDTVTEYCDQVKNCQGILALNGDVYVTGEGPEGVGLYRLHATEQGGPLDDVKLLVKFKGNGGEHGVHGLALGPDGMLYVSVGNHTRPGQPYADSSPHKHYYEGDLVGPRYEDPGGHAVGVKVPGGTVIRTDIEGKAVELVAGGLRNAYDLAFNREGELFVHDSDMESDLGTTWYRPTKLFHIVPGGEYGWRSGWSKWPEYFADSLPSVIDTGRGSPTGSVCYDHFAFPARYHNSLFLADWSEGRILAVTMERDGASYKATTEVFLQGQPLNVTDLEVGPDGALYFVTGGRGTSGGLYRISWRGEVPKNVSNLGDELSTVIRHPQISSAWGRQKIAGLKLKLGEKWDSAIPLVAASASNPASYRTRAMTLMHLYGPTPETDLLVQLSEDKNEAVRAKAAELMGQYRDDNTHDALVQLLNDRDGRVRREACESLLRADQAAPVDRLTKMLKSEDRHEVWAARRLLENIPVEQWQDTVMRTDDHRVFVQGSLALLIAHPDHEVALSVVERIGELMGDFVSDRDFIDMLRLSQLAIVRGEVTPDEIGGYSQLLANEFPSGNSKMNRELARLLGIYRWLR